MLASGSVQQSSLNGEDALDKHKGQPVQNPSSNNAMTVSQVRLRRKSVVPLWIKLKTVFGGGDKTWGNVRSDV
jgi:hypothetical protein